MQSLSEYYHTHTHHPITPFSLVFLSGQHLLQLQQMLTVSLRYNSGNPDAPLVPFSDLLIARLIEFCSKFDQVTPHPAQMRITDEMFIREYMDNMTWDENYGSFWKRWCAEGIPDPNNIPLPIYGDKREMAVESSNYMLSHPFGTERLPRY
jgi:hypothetical protein